MRETPKNGAIAKSSGRSSGTLVLGDRCQLTDDFLKPRAPLFVGAGGHGSGILLSRVTVIQIAEVGDFTSQGHNVSQHISGIHTH